MGVCEVADAACANGGWNRSEGEYLEWRGDLLEHIDRWIKKYAARKPEAGKC